MSNDLIKFYKTEAENSTNMYSLNEKGTILDNLGNLTGAISYYDKALSLNPNDLDALKYKNMTLSNLSSTTESNSNGINFISICNTLQIALYHPCSELVNPDGTLTEQGQATVKCIVVGAAIGGIASFALPPGTVIEGLSKLAGPTGSGGLVKIDQLNSLLSGTGNMKGIINQLTRFIH